MTIEKFIKNNVSNLADKVYIAPDIPEKKLNGAIASMAPSVSPEYVLAVVDTTVFGSAKEGCLFVGDAIYIHAILSKPIKIELASIAHADYKREEIIKDDDKKEIKETVILYYKDSTTLDLSKDLLNISKEHLVSLVNEIVSMADDENNFVSTTQTCSLSMMDAKIKIAYLKMVCNFTFASDDMIDANEYAEIISLIVRIELNSEGRIEMRSYMSDVAHKEDSDGLITYLNTHMDEGSYDILKQSLLKDILFIARKSNIIWKENAFIVDLKDKLGINDEQVNYMVTAIESDETILKQRQNDTQVKKTITELVSSASAVSVPLAAIYFSGSVLGVSAAGITSGLAALGMGGILGFSSMFTGLGVAVLLGVGAYKGVKKVSGLGELENNKQREFMLQAIIKNSQKSLNYLIEDVNEITKQLQIAISEGSKSELKIQKLAAVLAKLSQGSKTTVNKMDLAERESLISKIPSSLNLVRLEELTKEATRKSLREVVISCYSQETVEKEDGSTAIHWILRDDLPTNTFEQLLATLDGIGYLNVKDATVASAMGAAKGLIRNIMEKHE